MQTENVNNDNKKVKVEYGGPNCKFFDQQTSTELPSERLGVGSETEEKQREAYSECQAGDLYD